MPEFYNLVAKYHNGDHFFPVTLCFSRTSYLPGNLRLVNTSSSFFPGSLSKFLPLPKKPWQQTLVKVFVA